MGARVTEAQLAKAIERGFFATAVLLEELLADPSGTGAGEVRDTGRVRFQVSPELTFPPSDVCSVAIDEDQRRARVTVDFFGLHGADSPLPIAYAEHVAAISPKEARGRVCAFLDILHHRLLSLFFQSWRRYRLPAARPSGGLVRTLLSLVGGTQSAGALVGVNAGMPIDARVTAWRTRTAAGLEQLLQRRLRHETRVLQLQPRRVFLDSDQQTRLGKNASGLGTTLLLGSHVTDRNRLTVEIDVGTYAALVALTPGGRRSRLIGETLQTYLDTPTDAEVCLVIQSGAVVPWRLGGASQRLGYHMWLGRPGGETTRVRYLVEPHHRSA